MPQSQQPTIDSSTILIPDQTQVMNPVDNAAETSDSAVTPGEINAAEPANEPAQPNPSASPDTGSPAPQDIAPADTLTGSDAPAAAEAMDQLPEVLESTGMSATSYGQITELLNAGGPVLLVLLVLSVVGLTIFLLKWWQFTVLKLDSRDAPSRALRLWQENQPDAAVELVSERRQPVAQVLSVIMRGLRRPDIDVATVREEAVRVASAQMENLRSHLRALEIIGTVSPLLGLLGTVLGMIQAFQQLELAGNQVDPAILSGGIWQALLTTAAGLAVAIPAVLAHAWLERKVERCGHCMEDAVTQLFTRNLQPIPLRPKSPPAEANVTYAA